jgi:hypothetical protein
MVDRVRIFFIYFFWWMSQIILLVVLLNFVIALISQYYEDIMNSKIMLTYWMKHQLNREYYIFYTFLNEMGLRQDKKIDALILFDGNVMEN